MVENAKRIILSDAQQDENMLLAAYLLERGHFLALISHDNNRIDEFFDSLIEEHKERCFIVILENYTEDTISEAIETTVNKMQGLDIFINGIPPSDEAALFKSASENFGEGMTQDFAKLFLLNREIVRGMVRQKSGNIIFPIIDDILHFAGYPTSPVQNQGRLSLMKSMAKELAPFNIRVNSLTFGIYDPGLEAIEKRAMQKRLEFCALKPPIPKWEDLLPALDALINPSFKYMTGQNYSACIGSSNS